MISSQGLWRARAHSQDRHRYRLPARARARVRVQVLLLQAHPLHGIALAHRRKRSTKRSTKPKRLPSHQHADYEEASFYNIGAVGDGVFEVGAEEIVVVNNKYWGQGVFDVGAEEIVVVSNKYWERGASKSTLLFYLKYLTMWAC